MSVGNDQRIFTLLSAKLVIWAYQNGYELTDGDAYRDKRVHGEWGEKKGYGHPESFHKKRLAKDYNLFIDGVWQIETEDFKEMGEYWKSLDPKCSWGGDFPSPDGNHFSYGESRA